MQFYRSCCSESNCRIFSKMDFPIESLMILKMSQKSPIWIDVAVGFSTTFSGFLRFFRLFGAFAEFTVIYRPKLPITVSTVLLCLFFNSNNLLKLVT